MSRVQPWTDLEERIFRTIKESGCHGVTRQKLVYGFLFLSSYEDEVAKALQRLRKGGRIYYYSPIIGWRAGNKPPEAL